MNVASRLDVQLTRGAGRQRYRPSLMRLRFRRRLRKRAGPTLDDVYRLYGTTMEIAQLFEQIWRGHATMREYEALQFDFSSRPFEQMKKIERWPMGWIEKRYELPEDARELAVFARGIRNDLAHTFFASIDKHTPDGRRKAIQALHGAINLFGAAILAIYNTNVRLHNDNLTPKPDETPEATRPLIDVDIESIVKADFPGLQ